MQFEVGQTYADTKRQYRVERVWTQPNGTSPRPVLDMSFKIDGTDMRSTRTFWASTVEKMIADGQVSRMS